MRDQLRMLRGAPSHPGLAYDVWAAFDAKGELGDSERAHWLESIADTHVAADYVRAYDRFRASLLKEPGAQGVEGRVDGRLLIGHGNASPVGIGLTLHHTWGVPIIPGSALKGLLSQYLEATYGPIESDDDPTRDGFQAAAWGGRDGNRLVAGPGDLHRALFGAPAVGGDDDPGAAQGRVVFHDALFVPGSVEHPLAVDVLTVHQRRYYGQGAGARTATRPWPSDHDDPTPVPFLTVRPGAGFFIALTGDAQWCAFAIEHLCAALVAWGIGGKTAAGYGHFVDGWRSTEKVRIEFMSPAERADEAFGALLSSSIDGQVAWLLGAEGDPKQPPSVLPDPDAWKAWVAERLAEAIAEIQRQLDEGLPELNTARAELKALEDDKPSKKATKALKSWTTQRSKLLRTIDNLERQAANGESRQRSLLNWFET